MRIPIKNHIFVTELGMLPHHAGGVRKIYKSVDGFEPRKIFLNTVDDLIAAVNADFNGYCNYGDKLKDAIIEALIRNNKISSNYAEVARISTTIEITKEIKITMYKIFNILSLIDCELSESDRLELLQNYMKENDISSNKVYKQFLTIGIDIS